MNLAGRGAPVLGGVLAGASAIYIAAFDPARSGWFPPCAFRSFTGQLCPGCGMTRAMHHLIHGDVATAVAYNPLVFPTLALVAIWAISVLRGRKADRSPPLTVAIAVIVVLVGFGVVRNVVDLGAAVDI